MVGVEDAVHNGVAQLHVWVGHVYFGTEDFFAVGEFAVTHALEEVEVFLYRAVAVGTVFARFGYGSATGADFFLGLVVNVGESFFD